jgi:hypothetical protein
MLKPSIRNPVQAPMAPARFASGAASVTAADGEGRAEPLQRACADDYGSVGSERDHHRGQSEQRDPAGGGPSRPELVRCLAAQNDENGGGQQIGVHRPFHHGGTEREAARHLRQRSHDGRAVLADREHRQATGDQHQAGITWHELSECMGHPKSRDGWLFEGR